MSPPRPRHQPLAAVAPPPHQASAALAWAEWLRTRKWDAWRTLTFAVAVSPAGAEGAVAEWLAAVCAAVHPSVPYAAYAIEHGTHLARTHVHCLLGGIGAVPAHHRALDALWTAGRVDGGEYDPRQDIKGTLRGACAYLVKHPDAVAVYGRLRKYRPRVR